MIQSKTELNNIFKGLLFITQPVILGLYERSCPLYALKAFKCASCPPFKLCGMHGPHSLIQQFYDSADTSGCAFIELFQDVMKNYGYMNLSGYYTLVKLAARSMLNFSKVHFIFLGNASTFILKTLRNSLFIK